MSEGQEVRAITPLLQGILSNQIGKIMEALDNQDLDRAYKCLKTLISASPPKVVAIVLADLNKLDDALDAAKHKDGVDEYSRRRSRSGEIWHVYREKVRPLFATVMGELYKGKYLQLYATEVESNIPPGMLETVFAGERKKR